MKIEEFLQKYTKFKEDIFGLITSGLIYFIMLPLIIAEHRRPVPREIDLTIGFFSFQKMPMVLYILVVTVMLATAVNFFRDILNIVKQYFGKKVDEPSEIVMQVPQVIPNIPSEAYNPQKPIYTEIPPTNKIATNYSMFGE